MRTDTLSPLRLESCTLRTLEVDVPGNVQHVGATDADFRLGFDLGIKAMKEPHKCRVSLGIAAERPAQGSSDQATRIKASVEAVFSLPGAGMEEAVGAVFPNTYAILYGIIRGIVAQATGPTAEGCIWLPSVNFIAVIQDARVDVNVWDVPPWEEAEEGSGETNG